MSNEILSLIYTFSRKFNDPKTNLAIEKKNKNMETYLSLIILFLIILMVFSIDSNILT